VFPLSTSYDDLIVHFLFSSYVIHFVYIQCIYGRLMLLIKVNYYLLKNLLRNVMLCY
jgi:hypothetical protein